MVSPAVYWGKKFINSANRQYVILAGYTENLEDISNSTVFYTDLKGRIMTSGLRWSLFLISYIPSMDVKTNELSK